VVVLFVFVLCVFLLISFCFYVDLVSIWFILLFVYFLSVFLPLFCALFSFLFFWTLAELFCYRFFVFVLLSLLCSLLSLLFAVKAAAPLEVVVGEGCRAVGGRICALACLRGVVQWGFLEQVVVDRLGSGGGVIDGVLLLRWQLRWWIQCLVGAPSSRHGSMMGGGVLI
jgi:hypothetical protein